MIKCILLNLHISAIAIFNYFHHLRYHSNCSDINSLRSMRIACRYSWPYNAIAFYAYRQGIIDDLILSITQFFQWSTAQLRQAWVDIGGETVRMTNLFMVLNDEHMWARTKQQGYWDYLKIFRAWTPFTDISSIHSDQTTPQRKPHCILGKEPSTSYIRWSSELFLCNASIINSSRCNYVTLFNSTTSSCDHIASQPLPTRF